MAVRSRKPAHADSAPESQRKLGRPAKIGEDEPEIAEEEEWVKYGIPAVSESRRTGEPDPREVENLTDRIFAAVLSRYGWTWHNGHSEHVGEKRQTRR